MHRFSKILTAVFVGLFLTSPVSGQTEDAAARNAEAAAPFRISTLETVRTRGYLICGATSLLPGFAQVNSENLWSGFDVDMCRAVAAAVFGDPSKVEFRPLTGEARFTQLAMGDVDIIARNAPWTMSRDTQYGVSYIVASFFDGQAFLVPQRLDVVSAYELEDVTVCIIGNSEAARRMREFFFEGQVDYEELNYESEEDLAVAYRAGQCDALSGSSTWLQAVRRTLPDPTSHIILPERLSKRAYGPVARSDDQQWQTIIRWTLYAMVNAEEYGVTSINIDSMLSARTPAIRQLLGVEGDFGTPLGLSPTWMRDVIDSVGNYGELYNRHFSSANGLRLLRGQNALWLNGGLIYAPPLR